MLRFGSVRLALPAVSFDDVPVGTVRFGATHLPPTSRTAYLSHLTSPQFLLATHLPPPTSTSRLPSHLPPPASHLPAGRRWEGGGGRRGGGGGVGGWGVGGGRREVGGGGGRASVRFGAVPTTSVRFDTGAGGSIRYSVKVLEKRPC